MKATLVNEEWRPVVGYKNYEVSNFGRARSFKYKNARILKQYEDKGYLQVALCKNGKRKWFKVHRLVYETFIGVIPEGMQVNHINELKTDNSVWNLNLMTPKENTNYGTRNQKAKKKLTNGKLSDPVLQLTLDEELVKEWPSIMEADRNGFCAGAVSACCLGKRKTYKGFKWRKKY